MTERVREKNVVHEMSIWKQLIDNEHRTAKEWDANWGFLKMTRSSDSGKGTDRAESRNVTKTEEVHLTDYEQWSKNLAKNLARGHEATRQAIVSFMEKQGRTPNYSEVVKSAFEPFEVKAASSDELERVTVEVSVRRPLIETFEITYKTVCAKANASGSRLATPRLATTPFATPRNRGGSRVATPRMAATGMAVVQDLPMACATQPPRGVAIDDMNVGYVQPSSAKHETVLELANRVGDKRLKVLANMAKTPRDRFGRQVLSSHEVGWGKSLEKFGVNHHGKKRSEELWPAL